MVQYSCEKWATFHSGNSSSECYKKALTYKAWVFFLFLIFKKEEGV